MIGRIAFCELIESFKVFYRGVDSIEKCFNFVCEDNFLSKHIDSMLDAMVDTCFTDEELSKVRQAPHYHLITAEETYINNSLENVFNFIFDFCITRNFGETDNEDILVIQKDGETVESYNCRTSDELYTIIDRYLRRNCDEMEDMTYYINCMCLR